MKIEYNELSEWASRAFNAWSKKNKNSATFETAPAIWHLWANHPLTIAQINKIKTEETPAVEVPQIEAPPVINS